MFVSDISPNKLVYVWWEWGGCGDGWRRSNSLINSLLAYRSTNIIKNKQNPIILIKLFGN